MRKGRTRKLASVSARSTAPVRPAGTTLPTHPPPPAPQTLLARAPALRAVVIARSISGVLTPSASPRRCSHSSRSRRAGGGRGPPRGAPPPPPPLARGGPAPPPRPPPP